MPVPITALYAAILVFVGSFLAFKVGAYRGKTGISILHGDDMELAATIRRHDNFTENVPFILILFALLELNGASAALLHGLGIALVIARVAHPIGLKHDDMKRTARLIGAVGTLLVSTIAALVLLWQFASA